MWHNRAQPISPSVSGVRHAAWANPDRAWQSLREAMQIGAEIGAFFPVITALPAVALLFADRDRIEGAVEFYSCAVRHPYVANSRWFEDVAGREIAAAAAATSGGKAAAAQERGRARDLETTIRELVDELSSGVGVLRAHSEGRGQAALPSPLPIARIYLNHTQACSAPEAV